MDLRCPITSLGGEINRRDICVELLVFNGSGRRGLVCSLVVGTAVDIKYLTHQLNRIDVLIFCYEGNGFSYCFLANMAVAFFNISFSISSSCIFF